MTSGYSPSWLNTIELIFNSFGELFSIKDQKDRSIVPAPNIFFALLDPFFTHRSYWTEVNILFIFLAQKNWRSTYSDFFCKYLKQISTNSIKLLHIKQSLKEIEHFFVSSHILLISVDKLGNFYRNYLNYWSPVLG